MPSLIPVKFVKQFGMYQPKDIAGFSEKRAEALVKGGVAVHVPKEAPKSQSKSSEK